MLLTVTCSTCIGHRVGFVCWFVRGGGGGGLVFLFLVVFCFCFVLFWLRLSDWNKYFTFLYIHHCLVLIVEQFGESGQCV